MLVIAGTIRIDPAKQALAEAAAREMMQATRREAGCRAYVFSTDLSEPGLIHLFEEWESKDALEAHFGAPHMAAFQRAVAGFGVKEMKVQRYEVASVGPVRG
jgi:quinol monooxygenase YgiN